MLTIVYSLASQPYFSLFPVGGARGREKYFSLPLDIAILPPEIKKNTAGSLVSCPDPTLSRGKGSGDH